MTIRLVTIALALGLLALAGPVHAQVNITITGGQEQALPIAVVPLQATGGAQAPDTDIAGIVRADLRRSGVFEPLPPENFVAQPGRGEDVRFANWRALGADHLVVGRVAPAPGGYELRVQLLDVYGGEILASKVYTVDSNALRTAAHTISNMVFEELVGRAGGFGTKLVYVRAEGGGEEREFKLIYADADGYRPQTILTSDAPLLSPAWAPGRDRIAYVSFENNRSEIFVQEVATGQRRKVAGSSGINSAPAFGPEGRRLAFTRSVNGNPDIHILDLESGDTRRLTSHYGIDTEAVWTPDGDQLLFTSDRAGGPQIYRVAADGNGKPERVTYEGDYNASPDLSPDGELLTMVHRDDSGFHIAVMNRKKDLMRVLTDGQLDESPSFSPNGAMIVYTRSKGAVTELATVSVHGRANDSLRQFDGEVREPAWSPL